MYSIKHKLVNKVYKGNYLLNKNHITDLLSQKKTFKVLYFLLLKIILKVMKTILIKL